MKKTTLAIYFAVHTAVLSAEFKEKINRPDGPLWNIVELAYGQFRMIPSKVIPGRTSVHDWSGPSSEFKTFTIRTSFSKWHQTSPENFHSVVPNVGIEGSDSNSTGYSGTQAFLFDKAATESDVEIIFHPVPDQIQLDREYPAATISGKGSIVTWELFIRFTREKPSYVR